MFAAIDWNEVLMKAQIGGVLGGVGGACAGLILYLTRKSDGQQQAEFEARERARIHAQMRGKANSAKPTSGLFLLLAVPAIIVACILVVNPSLVAPLFRAGAQVRKPSATITDFGRYRAEGPVRTVTDRNRPGEPFAVNEAGVRLLEQTDQIPRQVGETWGFRIRSSDVPANRVYTVRQETYHPPLKRSDGSLRTKSVGEFQLPPGQSPDRFYGWYFLVDYEYELVAGEWTFVVFIDDVEVARKAFTIQK